MTNLNTYLISNVFYPTQNDALAVEFFFTASVDFTTAAFFTVVELKGFAEAMTTLSTLNTPAPSTFSTGSADTEDLRGYSGIPLGFEMDLDGG